MDVELDRDAKRVVNDWLADLNAALEARAPERLGDLFRPDADWRDIVALTRTIKTVSDRAEVARQLLDTAAASGASDFAIDPERYPPRDLERAGEPCVEAILTFETAIGTGAGIVRLKRSDCRAGAAQARTLLTSPSRCAVTKRRRSSRRQRNPLSSATSTGPTGSIAAVKPRATPIESPRY